MSKSRRNRRAEDEESDTASIVSDGSYKNDEMTIEDNQEGKVEESFEKLGDKRAATRVAALKDLTKLLRNITNIQRAQTIKEYLLSHIDTSDMRLLNCIRKGAADESTAAATLASLIAISLGTEGENMYRELSAPLQEYARDSSKPAASRAEVRSNLPFFFFSSASSKMWFFSLTTIQSFVVLLNFSLFCILGYSYFVCYGFYFWS